MSDAIPTQPPDWVIQFGGFDYEHRGGVHCFSGDEGTKTKVGVRTLRLGHLPDWSQIEVRAGNCQQLEIGVEKSRWSTLVLVRPPSMVKLAGYMANVEIVRSEPNTTFEAPDAPAKIRLTGGGSVRLVVGDQKPLKLELDQPAGSTLIQGWLGSASGKTKSLKILGSTDSDTTVDLTGQLEVDANSSGALGEVTCTSLQLRRSMEVETLKVEGDLAIQGRLELSAGDLAVGGSLSGTRIRCKRSLNVDGAVSVGRAAAQPAGELELSGSCFAKSIDATILELRGTLEVTERVEVRTLNAIGSVIECLDLVADSIAAFDSAISCKSVRCIVDCEIGKVTCVNAEFGSPSKGAGECQVGELHLGGPEPGKVICHHTLKTNRLTGVGDVVVSNLICDEELTLRGDVLAMRSTDAAVVPVGYEIDDSGEISFDAPQPAAWGRVSLSGSARASSIVTGTLRADTDKTKVDGLLWAQNIEGSGRTIVADALWVNKFQGGRSLSIDCAGAVNVVELAYASSIHCRSLVLMPDCSVEADVIESEVLRCSGKLSAELRISDQLTASSCSIEGAVTVAGDCEIDAGSTVRRADGEPAVTWKPVDGPKVLYCAGDVCSILLAEGVGILRGSTIHSAKLTLAAGDFALIPDGEGTAEFSRVEVGGQARVLLVSEGVALRLPVLVPMHTADRDSILDVYTAGQHEVDIAWSASSEPQSKLDVRICCGAQTTLAVDPPREVTSLEVHSDYYAFTETFTTRLESFRLANSPLTLIGHFCRAAFVRETPIAIPQRDTQVEDVQGDLWLEECAGYVAASQPDRNARPARLVRVERSQRLNEESSVIQPTAQVVGFDVTGLSGAEIRSLGEAEIFEPERSSVRRWAKGKVAPEELRRRAQRSLTLMKALDGKSSSGSTRSTVSWSAARLQHRDRTSQHPVESGMRLFYRMVGYGQRPLPPLIVTLVVAAFWTVFSIGQDVWILNEMPFERLFCTEPPATAGADMPICVDSPAGFALEYLRSLTFPFRLFRFSQDNPPFPYLVDVLQPMAGITIGLPFLFFVWATRRFFDNGQDT